MSRDPNTRTGLARAKLAEVVRSDLSEIAELLTQALGKLEALRLESAGLNGLDGKLERRIGVLRPVEAELRADATAYHETLTALGDPAGPREQQASGDEDVVSLDARKRGHG